MTGSGSHIKITPAELHSSGSDLQHFGGEVASGGDRLRRTGSRLVSHASRDRSGVGAVIAKALGRGTEVAGKVFSEGGRVADEAGKRLHSNAHAHSENEAHQEGVFKKIHDPNSEPDPKPKSVGGAGGTDGHGGNGKANGGTSTDGFNDKELPHPHSTGTSGSDSGIRGQGANPRSPGNLFCEKDPIDVSTGQVLLEQTDAEFLAVLPLVFARTHFSAYRTGRWFGGNWVSTLDERIEVDADGASFAAADGTLQHYSHPDVGSWVYSDRGPVRPLTRTDDGGYLLDDHERTRLLYFAPTVPGGSVFPLRTVTDRNGNSITIDHDADGQPARVRHSGGYLVRVETSDRLVTALHSVAADGSEVELMRYAYTEGQLTEVINTSGQALRFSYDPAGRLVHWQDRNGEWYRYTYDQDGRCVRTEGSGGFLSGAMEYDTEHRITYSTDSLGNRSAFHMNAAGQVVREVDPLGNAVTLEWDEFDRLLRRTDALGRSTGMEYGETGHPAVITGPDGSQQRFERNELGQPTSLVTANGAIWRWEYDERGNLVREIDPTGATTSWTPDERGIVVAATDALGNTLRIESDASGLPIAVVDALGGVTRYQRDRFGRVTAAIDPMGGTERFGYTVEGKLAWHQGADGSVEQWTFDGEGNKRVHTDQVGAVTHTEVTHFDLVAGEVRPDGTRLRFAYDTEMRLVGVTTEQGLEWRYAYDPVGNLVRETDFNGRTVDYRYDAAGQLVERVNGTGETTTLRYDLAGNVVERACGPLSVRYTYSPTGELRSADDGQTRLSYERDALGQVTAETVNGRTVVSSYDALGRRVRRRTPSGAESSWDYNAANRPIAVHVAGRTLRFDYDRAGREVRRMLDSGAVISQDWTRRDELGAQTVTTPTGLRSQQRSYAYRPDGLLTGVRDQVTGPRTFNHDPRGRVTGVRAARWTEHYAYDATGNITHAAWPTAAGQDALGERTYTGTVIDSAGQVRFTHDDRGRIVRREHAGPGPNAGAWQYLWGPEDRLVGVQTPDGTRWRYRYDPLGRRIAKERLGADGTSVAERVDFVWDDELLVEQVRHGASGAHVMAWDYEPESDHPLLQHERRADAGQNLVDERFYAIVTDQIGLPMELVDEQGGIAWFNRTSLWGTTMMGSQTAADTPLRFPGQYFDGETGLHYNFHRYYDPTIGQYASPDPVGFLADATPHSYVANPHTLADPLGLAGGGCGKRKRPNLTVNTSGLAHDPHGNPIEAQSPGGRMYQMYARPAGRYANKTRRYAYGYVNPEHFHTNMLPHWRGAATSPIPPGMNDAQLRKHFRFPQRHFQTFSNTGVNTGVITGHSEGVLGHNPSASAHWNAGGMTQSRDDNMAHNKQTGSYHGIEEKHDSAASGAHDPNYEAPRPDNGAHRQYWDQNHPGFTGGPDPSWRLKPQQNPPIQNPPATQPGPPAKKPRRH